MLRRTTILSTIFSFVLSGLLIAGPAFAQRIPPKDTLRIVSFNVKVLDPHFGGGGSTEFFQYKVYDTLFAFDANMKVQPQMVESFSWNEDQTKMTITLRPGLQFHDGQPVRAADAAASVKRWGAGPKGTASVYRRITESLDVVDDRTFVWTLKEPFGMALEVLTSIRAPAAIMPERIANTPVKEQITDFTGSGPFVFLPDEYVPGKHLHFRKFEGYIPRTEEPSYLAGGKRVHVDRLEWKIIQDPATMVAALRNGEVDLVQEAPNPMRGELVADPDITLKSLRTGRQGLIFINHLAPPFNDRKARQALLWTINQEEFLTAMVGDPKLFKVCPAYWTCGGPYETDVNSEALMGQDLDKAKRLLEEAGYKGEKIIILSVGPLANIGSNALVLAASLRRIGADVEVQEMNYGAAIARKRNKDNPVEDPRKGWHLMPLATQEVTPSYPALTNFLDGGCEDGGTYWGWACDPRIDDLKGAFGQAGSEAERMEVAVELQKVVYDSVPYIQIGQYSNEAAFRSNIKGAVKAPLPVYWNIRKE